MVSTLYTVHWHCTGLDARWPLDKYLCIDIRKWDIEQKLRWYPRFVAKHWPAHDGAPPAGCGGGALLIPQEVISHSPWRPHPLHTTHLGGGLSWGTLGQPRKLKWFRMTLIYSVPLWACIHHDLILGRVMHYNALWYNGMIKQVFYNLQTLSLYVQCGDLKSVDASEKYLHLCKVHLWLVTDFKSPLCKERDRKQRSQCCDAIDRVPAKLQTEINVVLIQSHNIHPYRTQPSMITILLMLNSHLII